MISPIKHLFIIGNGFDIEHHYKTKYDNFRIYLIEKFSITDDNQYPVPESTMMPDGDEVYDEEDIANYIVRIIDECDGEDWRNLEAYLGSNAISAMIEDLDYIEPEEESEKVFRNVFYNNEDLSKNMKDIFPYIKKYFCEWIMEYYSEFTYGIEGDSPLSRDRKEYIYNVLKDGDGFINLNYTLTLEKLYDLDESKICHIHGIVGDDNDYIFFGHGEDDLVEESLRSFGAEWNLSELKQALRKDTGKAMQLHGDFLNQIGKDLQDIHTFGYSFSDVDFCYLEEIARRVGSKGLKLYINKFDDAKRREDTDEGHFLKKQLEKAEELGFVIEVDDRW